MLTKVSPDILGAKPHDPQLEDALAKFFRLYQQIDRAFWKFALRDEVEELRDFCTRQNPYKMDKKAKDRWVNRYLRQVLFDCYCADVIKPHTNRLHRWVISTLGTCRTDPHKPLCFVAENFPVSREWRAQVKELVNATKALERLDQVKMFAEKIEEAHAKDNREKMARKKSEALFVK